METIVTYAVATNPSAEDIDPKAAACMENRCDLVVALGGGGSIDIDKAVAAVAINGRSSWDYAALETKPYEEITSSVMTKNTLCIRSTAAIMPAVCHF